MVRGACGALAECAMAEVVEVAPIARETGEADHGTATPAASRHQTAHSGGRAAAVHRAMCSRCFVGFAGRHRLT